MWLFMMFVLIIHDVRSGCRAVLPDIDEQYPTQALPVCVLAADRMTGLCFLLAAGNLLLMEP